MTSGTDGGQISGEVSQGLATGKGNTISSPGIMLTGHMGTRWVDATHWEAILDDIRELKDCTEALEQADDEFLLGTTEEESSGPTLFVGLSPLMNRSDVLAFLPPRPVVDRLISRYFNAKEPSTMILHVPTFHREYTQFWENQQAAPIAWVGLLFDIMCYAIFFYARAGDSLPGSLGEPAHVSEVYRTCAAQCLVLANYTTPGRYKVETLLLYSGTEFLRTGDTQIGSSILGGIITRLAMHMGYHRDSKHYQNLSVFDGEMRRRVWALIWQADNLISFQVGLPKTIPDLQCDTGLPHNLLDEDFDETTKALPSPRPMVERTPVTYAIVKSKLMSVFGRIAQRSYSATDTKHEDVAQLDEQLQIAHNSLPAFLRIRTMNMSIMDPADLIMQRYNLELLYQKARCVLHRRYLVICRSDLRYAYSRWSCVDAATQILRHQNDIYHETQPGGQLHRDRWFVTSLTSHDFLLAAMILCLELSSKTEQDSGNAHLNSDSSTFEGRQGLLRALETSYSIWIAFTEVSPEARKASKALEVMLQIAKKSHQGSVRSEEESADNHQSRLHNAHAGAAGGILSEETQFHRPMPGGTYSEHGEQRLDDLKTMRESMPIMMEDMFNASEEFDWHIWDSQIRNNSWESTDETWIT
ncbi:uncharacterized protein TrAtP1_002666 [Trichoderma atroviride]|uniref:uncharacterized protein n=1 Tax=Hypocrea atroviridis TaxID=63577 RepID=UPI003322FE9E|nr:hypothetical protein TrAtP1_002666 [Trichoderma atroviride]